MPELPILVYFYIDLLRIISQDEIRANAQISLGEEGS